MLVQCTCSQKPESRGPVKRKLGGTEILLSESRKVLNTRLAIYKDRGEDSGQCDSSAACGVEGRI